MNTALLKTPAGPVSSYVATWTPTPSNIGALALDVPCGRGRHAYFLARSGYHVTALDNDPRQLRHLTALIEAEPSLAIEPVLGDANALLPGTPQGYDLAVIVHFVSGVLLARIGDSLASGGRVIYESYAGHGENWRTLPKAGEVASLLEATCDILDYRERAVGPSEAGAVVVRAVAQRR